MKIKIISYSFILSALFLFSVNAQVRQPHSLYFMETIPQTTQMNPAHQPRANGYVSFPLANVNADAFIDIALKDILQQQNGKWYMPLESDYNYNELQKSIGKKSTMFNMGADIDLLGFGFRKGNSYWTFGISEHFAGSVALPSDIFKITEDGFPDGSNYDFSPLRVKALLYTQLNVGYSRKFSDKLTIGINVKPIIGNAGAITKLDKLQLTTGLDKWTMGGKGEVYNSSPYDITQDADGKFSFDSTIDSVKTADDWMNVAKDYLLQFKNRGIAFDFGASYDINERINISASVNNFGLISWNNKLSGISIPGGDYEFTGVPYDLGGEKKMKEVFNDFFDELGDEIINDMEGKVNHNKFTTTLAPVINVGASYKFSKSISTGFLSRSVIWQNGVRQSFNLSLYLQPYSFVAFNLGGTYQVKGNAYLGGGFMFHFLRVFQFYLLADYIPIKYSTLTIDNETVSAGNFNIPFPERQKSLTYRLGLNLVFGRHGYSDRPMLDKGKSSWN